MRRTKASTAPPQKSVMLSRFQALPEIKFMGKMILDPVWAREMHPARTCELMHVTRGTVGVRIGKHLIEGKPGDILLIPVGTIHRDEFDLSVGLEVFYIWFDWPLEKDYFRIVPVNDVPRLCAPMADKIWKLYDWMQIGLKAGTETDQLLIGSYMHLILLLILREALRSDQQDNPDARRLHGNILLLKAREYIDLHYAEPISLEQIADNLQISPFYLSHLFSRKSDFSFMEYLIGVRMRKAKDLLAEGMKNVAEVAYAVGYNDSNYFSKVFHHYFGVSPKVVRCRLSDRTPADNYPLKDWKPRRK